MTEMTRERAVATLEEGDATIRALLERLPDEALTRPATIGGGEWSAKDLIGHLATWEQIALRTIDEWRSGVAPWITTGPETTDEINERTVAEKAQRSLDSVRSEAASVHRELVLALQRLSESEWAAPIEDEGRIRTFESLLGGVLGAPRRPFGHAFAHAPDLEAFARSIAGAS
jgi:DinB superfamily